MSTAVDFRIDVADLSTSVRPEERFDEEARVLAHAGFDLTRAPLLRVALRRLGENSHGLAVVVHHIVTDGWSIPILVRELMACYRGASIGRAPDLPPLRIQYKDFAAWQHTQLQEESAAQHRDYWRHVFAESPTPLDLPTDFARPAVQTFEGDQFRLDFDADLAGAVRALAERQGVSLFVMLLASVTVLLARTSGQDDVTLGSPIAGRTHPSLDDQIGYYVNLAPLRTRVRRGESFAAFLHRVRDVFSAAVEHQTYPFDRLVEDLVVARDLGRSPLFDVVVAMDTSADVELTLPGLRVETRRIDYRVSKFDLTVTFQGSGRGLAAVFEYNTALFRPETIHQCGSRLERLLRALVDRPGAAVGRLPLLSEQERHDVLDRWNWEPMDRPRGRGLATLFEEQAARTPHATAIVFDGNRLSYGDLDAWANGVASELLVNHGVRPEEPVGLMVDASDRMIAGLLGILKAGATYVPLDPGYPLERNTLVLDDAGIRVLVKSGWLKSLREDLICLDPARVSSRDARPARRSDGIGNDERLAYILYTSGSTGRPKGVAVPHRGVVNLLADCQRRQPIRVGDGCALWTSVSFDVSVYEIFSALLSGGCLHIATEEMRGQPRAYFAWLVREQIAHAYIAPFHLAAFREFLSTARERPPLSRLLVGVEPIDERLLSSIRALIPGLHVINGYGPTEASICATLYDVGEAPLPRVTPIGRAVANTAAYLLDSELQPVGVGVVGEIYLAGDGLARGYHADPVATAEAFVPCPFGPVAGARLYRTGDLGRRLHDGSLMFVGRNDQQVKVRGHRVEIGEVERALRDHPSVLDAAVVARQAGSTRDLVAFLVIAGSEEPTADALRSFLKRRLPEYMVPARYAIVDALPLTPGGKVDRRALLARDDAPMLRVEAGYAAPRGAREEALARVWAEVLGVARVGVQDNYFALGGDSIKAIQIAARAAAQGLSVTIRDLFEHPTVAALALAVSDRGETLPQEPVVGDVPLTAVQEWFFRQGAGSFDHFNQAVLLRWNEVVDADALRAAGAAWLEHHDALRTCCSREASGAWTQRIQPTAEISWTFEDLRALDQRDAVARMERLADGIHAGLDLGAGRLIAGGLFRLPDGDRVLFVVHHLVVDGVSWRILLEDLDVAYRAVRDGRAPRLPPKTHSFKAWAEAVRLHAQSPDTQIERDYWRDVCATTPEPLAPGSPGLLRETIREVLDPIATRSLLTSAHVDHGAEPVHLLLAGLAAALRDCFGRSRTLVTLEGHGRESSVADLDVTRTVGWFTCFYPFLLESVVDAGVAAGVATDGSNKDAGLRAVIQGVTHAMRLVPRKGVGYGLLRVPE